MRPALTSQYKLAQILLLQNLRQPAADVGSVDLYALFGQIRAIEADILHHALQYRVQPAGADVLRRAVHFKGDVGESLDAVGCKLQLDSFGCQQFGVLLGERVLGLSQNSQEILTFQVRQFHTDWKSAL